MSELPKQFIDVKDLMNIFACSYPTAQSIMRCIKSVSDKLMIKGKVLVEDYEYWKTYRKEA